MSDPSEDTSHEVLKIFSLSGDKLVEFLEENGFSSEVCQMFTGNSYRHAVTALIQCLHACHEFLIK